MCLSDSLEQAAGPQPARSGAFAPTLEPLHVLSAVSAGNTMPDSTAAKAGMHLDVDVIGEDNGRLCSGYEHRSGEKHRHESAVQTAAMGLFDGIKSAFIRDV